MVVPNLFFDLILFGGLLVAFLIDSLFPQTHGGVTLLVVGAATYLAAEEWCDVLRRAGYWSQESLATALSLSLAGFIYYWWRNASDLAALVLHIGMMMASLMIMISVIAAASATGQEKSVRPIIGLFGVLLGSLVLGLLAGLLVYFLTSPAVPIAIKIVLLAVSAALWKVRERLRPPAQNELSIGEIAASATPAAPAATPLQTPFLTASSATTPQSAEAVPARSVPTHPGSRRALVPQRGTLLDRFVPVLVIGALLFVALNHAVGLAIK
ncbi:MAG TPA: hypothetical protein VF719_02645 [Abditibacteriaceae bacterium]